MKAARSKRSVARKTSKPSRKSPAFDWSKEPMVTVRIGLMEGARLDELAARFQLSRVKYLSALINTLYERSIEPKDPPPREIGPMRVVYVRGPEDVEADTFAGSDLGDGGGMWGDGD